MPKQGPNRGHWSRSRSLADFNRKFGKNIVQIVIQKALSSKPPIRVLEIGCGEGRVLLELRKLFPTIELHGINRKTWAAMKGPESLKRTATYHNIFTKTQLRSTSLPKIYFYDAKELKFPNNYFDLIISQVSIQYVARKDLLLEEVWRTLKLGGKALLNVDGKVGRLPDFLNFETPRLIIYKEGKIYPVRRLVSDLRKEGFNIHYSSSTEIENDGKKTRINLVITKNKKAKLKLNLHYDDLSSFNLSLFNQPTENWPIFHGYRSVYQLK